MSFMDLTKAELLEAASFYKVEVSAEDTKAEVVGALGDAGKDSEEYAREREAYVNGQDPEPEEEPEAEEELVLVKFTGSNRSYSVGRHTFTKLKPFALMPREQFETLDRKRFREASKKEAQDFYGN